MLQNQCLFYLSTKGTVDIIELSLFVLDIISTPIEQVKKNPQNKTNPKILSQWKLLAKQVQKYYSIVMPNKKTSLWSV